MVLTLLFVAGSASVSASRLLMPQKQAAHFCQLLLNDGTRVSSLTSHARQLMQAEDTLTVEQLFASFILQDDNWQGMRFFPHQVEGRVEWYSAIDQLPAAMDAEHQRYIHEVFPRLKAEVEAGRWATVDAYIEKMLQYQCRFGGTQAKSPVQAAHLAYIAVFFLLVVLVSRLLFVTLHPKRITS